MNAFSSKRYSVEAAVGKYAHAPLIAVEVATRAVVLLHVKGEMLALSTEQAHSLAEELIAEASIAYRLQETLDNAQRKVAND